MGWRRRAAWDGGDRRGEEGGEGHVLGQEEGLTQKEEGLTPNPKPKTLDPKSETLNLLSEEEGLDAHVMVFEEHGAGLVLDHLLGFRFRV